MTAASRPNPGLNGAGTCVVIALPKREPPDMLAAELKAQENHV